MLSATRADWVLFPMQGHPGVDRPAKDALSCHRALAQACPVLHGGLLSLAQALQQQGLLPDAHAANGDAAAADPAVVRQAAALLSILEPLLPAAETLVRGTVSHESDIYGLNFGREAFMTL